MSFTLSIPADTTPIEAISLVPQTESGFVIYFYDAEQVAQEVVKLTDGEITLDEANQAIETMDDYGLPIDPASVKEFIEDVG